MDILSHGISGYFVLLALALLSAPIELNSAVVVIAFFASMLPDIDGLWSKKLTGHHKGFLHTPIFWIAISLGIYFLFSKQYGILIGSFTLFHLFCDLITGRTTGIPVFYPISSKEFSLTKTHPRWGNMDPKKIFSKEYKTFIKHYFKDTNLILFEVSMWILGIASFVYLEIKTFF